MPNTVEPRIRTIAGVTSDGVTKFVTNGNATDYVSVRLSDGSDFYTATGSAGGGGSVTTVNVGSYGGTATTLGQKAKTASIPVTIASDNTVSTFLTNASDISVSSSTTINMGSYGGTSTTLGQKAITASIPVVIASDQPTVAVNVTSSALPSGGATAVLQTQQDNRLATIDSNIANIEALVTLPDGTAEPDRMIVVGGQYDDVSVVSPGENKVSPVRITSKRAIHANLRDDSGNELLGQKAMAASIPVTLASNQSDVNVHVQNFSDLDVSTTSNIGSYGGTATTLGQKAMTASLPVVLPNNQTVSVNVANFSDNAFSNTSNIGSYGGTATTLGQKAMTASMPVVVASDNGLATQATIASIYSIASDTTSTVGSAVPTKAVYVGFRDLSANLNFGRVFGNNTNIATQSGNVIGADAFTYVKNGSVWEPVTGIGSNGMTVTGSNITVAQIPSVNVSNTVTVTGSTLTIAQMPTTNVSITGQPISTTTNLNSWGGTATTIGQKAMTASVPVVIASDQSVVSVGGNIAHDAADSGNPVKIGGVAVDYTPDSTGRQGPTAVASGDRTNLPVSLQGELAPIRQMARFNFTGLETTYDDNPTTATGDEIESWWARKARLQFHIARTGTPTSMTVLVEESADGTNWAPNNQGPLLAPVIVGATAGTGYDYAVRFDVGPSYKMRVTMTATGTSSANSFAVTNCHLGLGT